MVGLTRDAHERFYTMFPQDKNQQEGLLKSKWDSIIRLGMPRVEVL